MAPRGTVEKPGARGLVRLSLCMIAKNEERSIGRCLDSARGVVDEMIVVDTGSQDSTPSIAASHGAVVVHHPWQNDFALARNVALDHAAGDWILVLDADEELESESRGKVRDLIATTDAEGFQLRQRSLLPRGELQSYEDLFITRLWRNRPHYRYEQPIHEQIRPSIERHGGRVPQADLTILHYGYAEQTVQGQDRRASRNLKLLEAAAAASPADPYLCYQLGVTYKALDKPHQARTSLRRALALDYQSLGPAILDKLFMKLAQLALASDDFPAALQHAAQSLACNPGNMVSLYVAALAHLHRGEISDAYRSFRQIRESPGDSAAPTDELDAVIAYCRDLLDREQPGSSGSGSRSDLK